MKKLLICLAIAAIAGVGRAQNNTTMKENKNIVTVTGNPLTLLGDQVTVGDFAKDFTATNLEGKDVHLSDFKGKKILLSIYPSIDTKVCAAQEREFNKRVSALSEDIVVLALSKDLPFALSRFCAAEGIDRIYSLSDYKDSEFGKKYGFLIKENMLLARGVVVIDQKGHIVHVEYVGELTHEPNYDAAFVALSKL